MHDDLVPGDRETLLARIEQQAEALAKLRVRAQQQSEELREAQIALMLVSRRRVYRLVRGLGRWGLLERRTRRALRSL